MIAYEVVNKLSLISEPHPSPYKLSWLQQRTDVTVTRHALISFSIGDAYKDQLHCDVVPMDACHLLLGRLWIYDRRIQHDGFCNTYSFRFNNRNFTLQPSLPDRLSTPWNPVLILQRTPFEASMREEGFVLILMPTTPSSEQLRDMFVDLLSEFNDVFFLRIYHQDCLHFVTFNTVLTWFLTRLFLINRITV